MKVFCPLLLFLILFNSCKTSEMPEINKEGIQRLVITPKEVNSELKKPGEDYYLFQPAKEAAKQQLFLFLPGSLVGPKIYQQLLRTAAENGYYSIGLSYPNNRTQTSRCRGEGADCQGKVSREIVEGKDYTDIVTVTRNASIEGRLIDLLHYLEENYPKKDWGQFLNNNHIRWQLITVAGHSQGSNHAAYIGWHKSVARVGLFSGPRGIANEEGILADWLQDERQTPASRFYGFGNRNDQITDFPLMQAAWQAMALPGKVVSVDGQKLPYHHSHKLATATGREGLLNGGHGSTCADAQTPMNENNSPVFKKVWTYMLFL